MSIGHISEKPVTGLWCDIEEDPSQVVFYTEDEKLFERLKKNTTRLALLRIEKEIVSLQAS